MMYTRELEIAKKCALEAGRAIMHIYNETLDMQVEYKDGSMPLTIADKRANSIIVEALGRSFPGYAVLSEEGKDHLDRLKNDYCFIVDPLDGTKEFIKRNGQFTVNIALAYKQISVMGVIYVPVTEELYYAQQGEGAYLQKPDGTINRLFVSDNTDINSLKVVMSISHECREMKQLIEKYQLKNFIKIGSSLKGCMVASGEADVYYRYNPTMEWDTAAMQCIVEEAGGIFRQMDDTVMLYNRKDSVNRKGFYIINRKANRLSL